MAAQVFDSDLDSNQALLNTPKNAGQLPPIHQPPTLSRLDIIHNDMFLLDEEPSSALASRILHAYDNPSPPPSPSSRRLTGISEPSTPDHHADPVAPSLLSPLFRRSPPRSDVTAPKDDHITLDEFVMTSEPSLSSINCPSHLASSLDNEKATSHEIFVPNTGNTDSDLEMSDRSSEHSRPDQESNITSCSSPEAKAIPVPDVLVTPRRSSRTPQSVTPCQTNPAGSSAGEAGRFDSPIITISSAQTRIRRKSARLTESPDKQDRADGVKQQHEIAEADQQRADALNDVFNARHRLDSLSPASSNVLSQLISVSGGGSSHSSKPTMQADPMPAMSFADVQETLSNKPNITGSPSRLRWDQSPPRPLPVEQLRTPARRILQVPASSSRPSNAFPPRPASANAFKFGLPRTPIFHIPPNDSPARRMVITERVAHSPERLKRSNIPLQSPTRRMNVRSYSEEPSISKVPPCITKERSNSVELQPVARHTSILSSKPRRLPFPLIPEAIPEESAREEETRRPGASSAPTVSSTLKQPTSKIPRIRNKPYAWPAAATRTVATKAVVLPKPIVGAAISQSKPVASGHTVPNRTGIHKPTTATAPQTAEQGTAIRKRKRSPEDGTSSSTRLLPHQVHRSVAPRAAKAAVRVNNSVAKDTQIVQQNGRVPGAFSQPPEQKIRSGEILPSQGSIRDGQDINKLTVAAVEVETTTEKVSSAEEQCPAPLNDPRPSLDAEKTPASKQDASQSEELNSTEVRRTTRSRRKTQSTSTKDTSRSPQSRRRANNSTVTDTSDGLSAMSAVALKALTNSNTIRNQQYIAAKIEVELIRKPGFRPTSPTVKVRTVVQRTQEERGRERCERAQRRAQRGEGASQSSHRPSFEGSESPTIIPLALDIGQDIGNFDNRSGHRRGAGEDEDYQMPDRQLRNIVNGLEPDDSTDKRRVKWDKGLFTEVRLDEVQLGAQTLHRNRALLKGSLAPTSKVVQLDTMGNVQNATIPVKELVEECIVVKKFVYDDDEELEELDPLVAQGTRSKAKGTKS